MKHETKLSAEFIMRPDLRAACYHATQVHGALSDL